MGSSEWVCNVDRYPDSDGIVPRGLRHLQGKEVVLDLEERPLCCSLRHDRPRGQKIVLDTLQADPGIGDLAGSAT